MTVSISVQKGLQWVPRLFGGLFVLVVKIFRGGAMVRSLQEDLESYGKPQAANIDSADLAKQSFDAVIIKNISERCTSGEILQSMEHCGFSIQNVTYIHLPSSAKGNLGYCFVGFKSSQLAKDFCESSEFQLHLRGKNKIIHVEPLGFSLPIYQKGQGVEVIQRFQLWHDGAEMWTGETWRKILRFAEAKRIRGKKTDLCAKPMCTLRFSRLYFVLCIFHF